jgi:hypothetical protein
LFLAFLPGEKGENNDSVANNPVMAKARLLPDVLRVTQSWFLKVNRKTPFESILYFILFFL